MITLYKWLTLIPSLTIYLICLLVLLITRLTYWHLSDRINTGIIHVSLIEIKCYIDTYLIEINTLQYLWKDKLVSIVSLREYLNHLRVYLLSWPHILMIFEIYRMSQYSHTQVINGRMNHNKQPTFDFFVSSGFFTIKKL